MNRTGLQTSQHLLQPDIQGGSHLPNQQDTGHDTLKAVEYSMGSSEADQALDLLRVEVCDDWGIVSEPYLNRELSPCSKGNFIFEEICRIYEGIRQVCWNKMRADFSVKEWLPKFFDVCMKKKGLGENGEGVNLDDIKIIDIQYVGSDIWSLLLESQDYLVNELVKVFHPAIPKETIQKWVEKARDEERGKRINETVKKEKFHFICSGNPYDLQELSQNACETFEKMYPGARVNKFLIIDEHQTCVGFEFRDGPRTIHVDLIFTDQPKTLSTNTPFSISLLPFLGLPEKELQISSSIDCAQSFVDRFCRLYRPMDSADPDTFLEFAYDGRRQAHYGFVGEMIDGFISPCNKLTDVNGFKTLLKQFGLKNPGKLQELLNKPFSIHFATDQEKFTALYLYFILKRKLEIEQGTKKELFNPKPAFGFLMRSSIFFKGHPSVNDAMITQLWKWFEQDGKLSFSDPTDSEQKMKQILLNGTISFTHLTDWMTLLASLYHENTWTKRQCVFCLEEPWPMTLLVAPVDALKSMQSYLNYPDSDFDSLETIHHMIASVQISLTSGSSHMVLMNNFNINPAEMATACAPLLDHRDPFIQFIGLQLYSRFVEPSNYNLIINRMPIFLKNTHQNIGEPLRLLFYKVSARHGFFLTEGLYNPTHLVVWIKLLIATGNSEQIGLAVRLAEHLREIDEKLEVHALLCGKDSQMALNLLNKICKGMTSSDPNPTKLAKGFILSIRSFQNLRNLNSFSPIDLEDTCTYLQQNDEHNEVNRTTFADVLICYISSFYRLQQTDQGDEQLITWALKDRLDFTRLPSDLKSRLTQLLEPNHLLNSGINPKEVQVFRKLLLKYACEKKLLPKILPNILKMREEFNIDELQTLYTQVASSMKIAEAPRDVDVRSLTIWIELLLQSNQGQIEYINLVVEILAENIAFHQNDDLDPTIVMSQFISIIRAYNRNEISPSGLSLSKLEKVADYLGKQVENLTFTDEPHRVTFRRALAYFVKYHYANDDESRGDQHLLKWSLKRFLDPTQFPSVFPARLEELLVAGRPENQPAELAQWQELSIRFCSKIIETDNSKGSRLVTLLLKEQIVGKAQPRFRKLLTTYLDNDELLIALLPHLLNEMGDLDDQVRQEIYTAIKTRFNIETKSKAPEDLSSLSTWIRLLARTRSPAYVLLAFQVWNDHRATIAPGTDLLLVQALCDVSPKMAAKMLETLSLDRQPPLTTEELLMGFIMVERTLAAEHRNLLEPVAERLFSRKCAPEIDQSRHKKKFIAACTRYIENSQHLREAILKGFLDLSTLSDAVWIRMDVMLGGPHDSDRPFEKANWQIAQIAYCQRLLKENIESIPPIFNQLMSKKIERDARPAFYEFLKSCHANPLFNSQSNQIHTMLLKIAPAEKRQEAEALFQSYCQSMLTTRDSSLKHAHLKEFEMSLVEHIHLVKKIGGWQDLVLSYLTTVAISPERLPRLWALYEEAVSDRTSDLFSCRAFAHLLETSSSIHISKNAHNELAVNQIKIFDTLKNGGFQREANCLMSAIKRCGLKRVPNLTYTWSSVKELLENDDVFLPQVVELLGNESPAEWAKQLKSEDLPVVVKMVELILEEFVIAHTTNQTRSMSVNIQLMTPWLKAGLDRCLKNNAVPRLHCSINARTILAKKLWPFPSLQMSRFLLSSRFIPALKEFAEAEFDRYIIKANNENLEHCFALVATYCPRDAEKWKQLWQALLKLKSKSLVERVWETFKTKQFPSAKDQNKCVSAALSCLYEVHQEIFASVQNTPALGSISQEAKLLPLRKYIEQLRAKGDEKKKDETRVKMIAYVQGLTELPLPLYLQFIQSLTSNNLKDHCPQMFTITTRVVERETRAHQKHGNKEIQEGYKRQYLQILEMFVQTHLPANPQDVQRVIDCQAFGFIHVKLPRESLSPLAGKFLAKQLEEHVKMQSDDDASMERTAQWIRAYETLAPFLSPEDREGALKQMAIIYDHYFYLNKQSKDDAKGILYARMYIDCAKAIVSVVPHCEKGYLKKVFVQFQHCERNKDHRDQTKVHFFIIFMDRYVELISNGNMRQEFIPLVQDALEWELDQAYQSSSLLTTEQFETQDSPLTAGQIILQKVYDIKMFELYNGENWKINQEWLFLHLHLFSPFSNPFEKNRVLLYMERHQPLYLELINRLCAYSTPFSRYCAAAKVGFMLTDLPISDFSFDPFEKLAKIAEKLPFDVVNKMTLMQALDTFCLSEPKPRACLIASNNYYLIEFLKIESRAYLAILKNIYKQEGKIHFKAHYMEEFCNVLREIVLLGGYAESYEDYTNRLRLKRPIDIGIVNALKQTEEENTQLVSCPTPLELTRICTSLYTINPELLTCWRGHTEEQREKNSAQRRIALHEWLDSLLLESHETFDPILTALFEVIPTKIFSCENEDDIKKSKEINEAIRSSPLSELHQTYLYALDLTFGASDYQKDTANYANMFIELCRRIAQNPIPQHYNQSMYQICLSHLTYLKDGEAIPTEIRYALINHWTLALISLEHESQAFDRLFPFLFSAIEADSLNCSNKDGETSFKAACEKLKETSLTALQKLYIGALQITFYRHILKQDSKTYATKFKSMCKVITKMDIPPPYAQFLHSMTVCNLNILKERHDLIENRLAYYEFLHMVLQISVKSPPDETLAVKQIAFGYLEDGIKNNLLNLSDKEGRDVYDLMKDWICSSQEFAIPLEIMECAQKAHSGEDKHALTAFFNANLEKWCRWMNGSNNKDYLINIYVIVAALDSEQQESFHGKISEFFGNDFLVEFLQRNLSKFGNTIAFDK